MTDQMRRPKGTDVGGQFAASVNPEADVELTAGTPVFTADQFEPYAQDEFYGTPADKAEFLNHMVRFANSEFDESNFTEVLYAGLNMHPLLRDNDTHFNQSGYYAAVLNTSRKRIVFVQDLLEMCDQQAKEDRPEMWSDVAGQITEHAPFFLRARSRQQVRHDADVENYERAEFVRLQHKFISVT